MGRGRMDFFEHRYYRTTKNVMLASLQWPYLSTRVRCGLLALELLFNGGQVTMMIMSFFKYHEDRDIFLQCIFISSIIIFCVTKHITTRCNSDKMLKLLNCIRADWIVWAGEREVNILHEYAEQERKYGNVYVVGFYSLYFVGSTQPLVLKIIDVVLHKGSKPRQFSVPLYIYLDVQKYYFFIILYYYITVYILLTISLSYDVMLFGYIQHCCGIFAALGHKLASIGANDKSGETGDTAYAAKQRNRTFEHLILTCIARHNDAIEYANLIEATYSWTFLVTMLFRLAIVSIAGFKAVTRINESHETVQFVACGLCFTSYVYSESYYSQVLRDHSISVRYYIQKGQWYIMSLKAQKLLLMMTMRRNVPCQLTAGNMINISVESFAVFLKTTPSYFTLLRCI